MRDVAIGPGGLAAGRRPRGIEQAGLRQENERSLRVGPRYRRRPRKKRSHPASLRDELSLPASSAVCCPRDGAVEGPVELEDPHAVPISAQPADVAGRQAMTGQPHDLPGRDVEEDGPRLGQLINRLDLPGGDQLAAEDLK